MQNPDIFQFFLTWRNLGPTISQYGISVLNQCLECVQWRHG